MACFIEFFFFTLRWMEKFFFLKRETLRNLRERCLTTERMEKFDLNGPIRFYREWNAMQVVYYDQGNQNFMQEMVGE